MKNITHFIFDFDGVIADTETVFAKFDCTLLNDVLDKAGIAQQLTTHQTRKLAGNNDITKLTLIGERFNFDISPYKDEFIKIRTKQRKTLFRNHPAPRGKNLNEFLKTVKGKTALATNKTAVKLHHDLNLMNLDNLFEIIITCDPPLRKKPAPDILLKAAAELNTKPENCAYIGDNEIDILAAINAKMTPIGFIIEGCETQPERVQTLKTTGAQIIIDDFAALIPYVIKP